MACCAAAAYVVFRFLRMHERLLCSFQGSPETAPDPEEPRQAARAVIKPHGNACIFNLGGLTCASCVADIENVLAAVPGVLHVSVSLALLRTHVVYEESTSQQAIIDAVHTAGFEAQPSPAAHVDTDGWANVMLAMQASTAIRAREVEQWKRAFGLAAIASVVFTIMNVWSAILAPHIGSDLLNQALYFVMGLSVAASLIAGWPLHSETVNALWHGRRPNMSTLGSLGILAALLQTFIGRHQAWDAVPILSTSVLGGRLLKVVLSRRSLDFGSPLVQLIPAVASVLTTNDTDVDEIPIHLVAPGDRLLLRQGDNIPCDGIVDSVGPVSVMETWMNGSNIPRVVMHNENVFAGSTVSQGSFVLRSQACGRSTRLGQMLASVVHVELASSEQPATGLALHFASVVLLITAVVCGVHFWHDSNTGWADVLRRASAMLLAACPCALSLSVPTVKLLATARAAKAGMRLSTRYRRMQDAASAGVVLFDKTGTLTDGVLQVAHIVQDEKWDTFVWEAIRALEAGVKHPAALAIVREAEQQMQMQKSKPRMTDTALIVDASHDIGRGVHGTVTFSAWSGTVAVGSRSYMESLGIHTNMVAIPEAWRTAVVTSVLVAVDGVQTGILLLQDRIRPDAAATVAALRQSGLQVSIVTGDSHAPAAAVARQIGIDSSMVFAGCLPEDKARIVRQFRRQKPTIFVGDNLNDIPSFASASFGICLCDKSTTSAGLDVADAVLTFAESADNRLGRILFLLRLLRQSRQIVSQNLAWALFYNTVALLCTSGTLGVIQPSSLSSSFGMALSSAVVALNSMRIESLA